MTLATLSVTRRGEIAIVIPDTSIWEMMTTTIISLGDLLKPSQLSMATVISIQDDQSEPPRRLSAT